jgi:hypothetical protein
MRALAGLAACAAFVVSPAWADEPLAAPLEPLAFMIGDWRATGEGVGAGAGGDSAIHPDLGGRVLIRRDHVLVRAGGSFDLYMLVYPDGGRAIADFIDTEGHTIHYSVAPGPGPSAVFESPGRVDAPGFRLTYSAVAPDRLHIRFEIAPPGGAYKTYSEGDVARR